MRGVAFHLSVPRYVLGRTLGRVTDSALYGRLSGLRLEEVRLPDLPGPGWVRLRVLAAGICGTDLGNLAFEASPVLEPFASFPAVLGHEILAEVEEVGPAVRRVETGRRVVMDPVISCAVRGYPASEACPSCAAGQPATCARAGEHGRLDVGGEPMAPGCVVGYHRHLPGGWGEEILAHESQLHPVSEALPPRAAVLVEPLSIGMRAVLRSPPRPEDQVLVIGSGPIAFGTIWALRATGFGGTLVAQCKRKHEAAMARRLGADDVVAPGEEARAALVEGTGASAYMPMIGGEVYAGGGFPLIFDCVGSRSSLDQALRFATPRGRIVLLGCAAKIEELDLTFLWARELDVKGYVGYGMESWRGERMHTFEVTRTLLREGGGAVEALVTHAYPLSEYRDALRDAMHHRKSQAVKVILEPGGGER